MRSDGRAARVRCLRQRGDAQLDYAEEVYRFFKERGGDACLVASCSVMVRGIVDVSWYLGR